MNDFNWVSGILRGLPRGVSFGEEILDIKVGDLKKEGKEGLVILSRSKGKVKMTKVSPH